MGRRSGGGGCGGLNVASILAKEASPILVGVGGFGSGGGHADSVTVRRGDANTEAGTIRTDGRGATGAPLPGGVYFLRLRSDGVESRARLVHVR